ncbi:MAG: DUF2784 family protein [Pseudobacteriovorax sp.]|nr:DUF2784 family protein [Pseudobacteriovorax sp.]
MLRIMDYSLHAFHCIFILFSIAGWAHPATHEYHLIVQGLVAVSWFGIGYFTYPGFCLLTKLHWLIREKRGLTNQTDSYIYWLIESFIAKGLNKQRIDRIIMLIYVLCTTASVMTFDA